MSSQPPDPFDQSSPDPYAPSAANHVDSYASDPAEAINHSPGYTNPLAIGSLVSGVIGVLLIFTCFCCPPFSLVGGVTSIVAIVLGVISLRQIKAGKGTGGGLAMVGIILGAVVLLLILAVIGFVILSPDGRNFDDLEWLKQDDIFDEGPIELPAPDLIPVEPEMEGLIPVEPDVDQPPSEPPTPTPKQPDDGSSNPPGP